MIDDNILALFRAKYNALTLDGKGDNYADAARGLTLGLVVNTDDPLEGGRLQVFCPALNDNPKKLLHLPWAMYVAPFGGSINNKDYSRGVGDGAENTVGAVSYGFWGIAELGAHVLVGCIDGDPRRRFWAGAVHEHQETHTLFNGRYDWSGKDGTPDGPLSSAKKPIQPLYDNWTKAFFDRESREWKSRGADYQVTANPNDGNGAPSKLRGEDYLDETYEGLSKNEKDKWVRDVLGGHGYDWSGYKGAGAFKASRVFGMSSPGFHAISMDDRPFNLRTKIRSASGHMILMDDTNERIYVMTNKGNNWVEMDSNGNIDVFSDRRVSINASKDINLTSGGTIRMHAQQGIHMYAGHNDVEGREVLPYTPLPGEIRIQSESEYTLIAKNIRNKTIENYYLEVGVSSYTLINDSSFTDVTNDINVRTLTGDYVKTIAKNLFETVRQDSKRMSMGTNAMTSVGNSEIYAFEGGLSVGANKDASFKSAGGNVDIEAMGQSGDTGNVRVNSPRSQITIGDDGISGLTSKTANFKAAENIEMEISPEKASGKSGGAKSTPLTITGIPPVDDCTAAGTPGPITPPPPGERLTFGQAAQVAYNAGWRGEDLTIATALMHAESSNTPNAVNGDASDGKWGPAVGLFQIRSLRNPRQYAGTIDELRDNTDGKLEDPNYNAKVAFKIWEKCSPPGRWSVGKWESFAPDRVDRLMSPEILSTANAAVQALCAGTPIALQPPEIHATFIEDVDYVPCGCDEDHAHDEEVSSMLFGAPSTSTGSSFLMSAAGVTLQSATDIDLRAMGAGVFNSYADIVQKLNTDITRTNMLTYYTSLLTTATQAFAAAEGFGGLTLPMSFDLGSITGGMFSGMMPPQLQQIAGSISQLNTLVSDLGGLGLSLPLNMHNVVSQLAGNPTVLAALGLPTDLSFPINGNTLSGLQQLTQLNKTVQSLDIPFLEIPTFRPIADKIFQNISYPIGSVTLSPSDLIDLGGFG